jgi:cytochrome c oxidase subunit 3/cytochrome o ubiquinol oxidase subunit 3
MTDSGNTPQSDFHAQTVTLASTRAAPPISIPPPIPPPTGLSPPQWGMIAFLVSEVAFFSTLIAAYVSLHNENVVGPTPADALELPLVLFTTACLLSSSVTVHLGEGALRRDAHAAFYLWWGATIVLGVVFLLGTAWEWTGLIYRKHLTISRNLFGTTYYTLVGFHALHVTVGVLVLLLVLGLVLRRAVTARNPLAPELVGWYWHFVDGVWIVVFTVVYRPDLAIIRYLFGTT